MQKKKNIAIIGGDARYLPLIHALNKIDDLRIQILGFDQVEQSYTGVMQSTIDNLVTSQLDGIILPITGIDDNGFVETMFSGEKIQLTEEWFKSLPSHCKIFTGIATSKLDTYINKYNLSLETLMNRDDVAIYNSIPTAEGAIMLAIKHTDFTIHHANVFVFGFGRVGQTTASSFAGLGANVSVISKDESELARIYEKGWQAYHLAQVEDYMDDCQILINTIPAKVVDKKLLEKMNNQAIIIDLASKPGGIDFDFAKTRGIEAIHALGLPGMVAPKTAGEILANTIAKLLFAS
ncbi:dipicolinic acid synthetase subunit A [Gracilibacillus caseinilyticus]|uniref:Dipicolinic acid synthetase subunit A n=1 Tax=Gracilibacillus caseinilyticus TaxID=2932256 RepID=A0ABY4EU76_9BACI|nr:dipicolinic acid synthetase subunit A [Gracilibacillus caseinilyticus]UOQ47824.1 dipicolinic acid synthetase subunit A [Gracilibacillus caseinilyticus]